MNILFQERMLIVKSFNLVKQLNCQKKTIDQYVTRLRKLAASCDFNDVSREIKLTVVHQMICP